MPTSLPEYHATLQPTVAAGSDSGVLLSYPLDPSASAASAAAELARNSAHCASNTSIAVFLFAKEKLLFRYPDTDPFVVDVAAQGCPSTSCSSAPTGGCAASAAAAAADASSKKASGDSNASSTPGTAHTSSSRDHHRSRGSHVEQARKGGGGVVGGNTSSGGTCLDPDDASSGQTAALSISGSGGSRLKKSPFIHVTMTMDAKDSHHHHGACPDPNASVSSSSGGVAPQRGMRRPASSYLLGNDHFSGSGGSFGHGQSAVSSGGGGTAAVEGRRGLTARGLPGNTPGTVTQAQQTPPGGMRRPLSGAAAGAAAVSSSTSGPSNARKTNNASAGSAAGGGGVGGSASSGGRNGAPQQLQQLAATTGAATCVGIAPNVLMHLLRGALCGTTTINMVNCTFLVFPLLIGAAAPNAVSGQDGRTGSSTGSFASLDRLRLPHRSGTALLVVAMKEPDTDVGAITNFTQCFVNILCREEHRCQYVSTELERMETLTNHWKVGGAAALASAATATAKKRRPHGEKAHQQQFVAGGAGESFRADASAVTAPSPRLGVQASRGSRPASASVSPASDRRHRALSTTEAPADSASPRGGDTDSSAASSDNYDYLFSPSRPAVRHTRVPAAASDTANEKTNLTSHSDSSAASGTRITLRSGYTEQHHHHHSRESSPSAALQGSISGPFLGWADPDDNAGGDDSAHREDGRDADHVLSHSALPSNGRSGEHSSNRPGDPSQATAASSPLTASASSHSLYQQLAVHVRLAYEVLRVAQCIDVWNRTMRGGCRAGNGAWGGAFEGSVWSKRTSRMTSCGRGATAALRKPCRGQSIAAAYDEQQQLTFPSAGTTLDALPEALLINRMLLLPTSHLTGTERQEEAQSLRSACSRIHPCSVLTIEADQLTEQLQHRYLEMMGWRYSKLVPLSTVYALLQALPSPRRAGSFYRSLELALLEAVQRHHARAAAAAAAADNANTTSVSSRFDVGATATSVAQADLRSSREMTDEGTNAFHASAAEAAATTAAGLDFLAMEIIDFLRVNGAISVASEMYVCFTHSEVTPVALMDAAVARRRRHRLKAERRKRKAAAAAVGALKESGDSDAARHGKRRHRPHYTAHDLEKGAGIGSNNEMDSGFAVMRPRPQWKTISESASASEGWMSFETMDIGPTTGASSAMPGAVTDPFEAVLDMETAPAMLVLHILERVVDTQQHLHQRQQQEQYHSLAVIGGSERREETAAPMESTTGSPKTHNTAAVGSVLDRTPPSSSTDASAVGNTSSHGGYRTDEQDTSLRPWGSGRSTLAAVNATPSPSLHFVASTTAIKSVSPASTRCQSSTSTHAMPTSASRSNVADTGAAATAPQPMSPLTVPGPLSVYCAWGSACPLCELLVAHPQCWTTRSHRGYTLGYYTLNPDRPRHYSSSPAIQLAFPSLDESVCTCARHARHLRDSADFTALMQNSYTGNGSSSLLHSMQPWFMRPRMFITPVTAAYGMSPYEVFERMSYHCNLLSSGSGHRQRLPQHHSSYSPMTRESVTTPTPVLAVNNTSILIEPDPRDPLISRAQAHPHETSMLTTSHDAVVGSAKEQAHTLLQCADIPEAVAEYLRRSADVIKQRLDYARRQLSLLERYEQAWEEQNTAPARTLSFAATATSDAALDAAIATQSASSAAMTVAEPVSSSAIRMPPAHSVEGAASFSGTVRGSGGGPLSSSSSSAPVSATVKQLGSCADSLPRSLRYGDRLLPLLTVPRPLSSRALLFDSTTPVAADSGADAPVPQRQQPQGQQQNYASSTHTNPGMQAIAGASTAIPLDGVGSLLGTERSLPVEVLLQYMLHHVIALTWGKRGLEVDTLVRLLEHNLRRLPPLLANLPYILQLRSAGYTSASAVAASASDTTRNEAGAETTAVLSSVFTTVHTRIAAPQPSSAPTFEATLQRSSHCTSPDRFMTSPYSAISHAAASARVTEAERELLQTYEVLDQLSLMRLLSAYATWPVRTVPTLLLLHTVVNEFSDVLYVDSSTA
nr:unnamed protein product [Leishmania braziliensis]